MLISVVVLLIPRRSHLGAILFLPIIANSAVLTVSVGFKGTWVITILMCLAATYLVAWEYDRLKPLVFYSRRQQTRKFSYQFFKIPAIFAAGAIPLGLLFWALGLGNISNYLKVTGFLIIAGFCFGVVVALHYRSMQVGELVDPGSDKAITLS